MFHIIASDLDGTLLTSKSQITPFTKKILQMLNNNNIHFVLATGRHHKNVIQIRDNLQIPSYMITSNGSRIHNDQGKLISSYNLDPIIISDMINITHNDPTITINIFQNEKWFVNQLPSTIKENTQIYNIECQLYNKDAPPLTEVCKIHFTSNNYSQLLKLEKKLNKKWKNSVNISFSLPTCLEIVPQGVSKGHALKKVAHLLGYQLKDCISFGDGMNDQEMLSMTGKGCIMKNAQKKLKESLPFLEIIGNNEQEAVPHYLKKLYFN